MNQQTKYTLYIGCKDVENRVRCLKDNHGNLYFPPYGQEPVWSKHSDQYVLLDPPLNLLVERDRTVNSHMQCWGVLPQSFHLSKNEFEDLLKSLYD